MPDFPHHTWRDQDRTPWLTYEDARGREREREHANVRHGIGIARHGRFAAGWALGTTATAVLAYTFAGVAGALTATALATALAVRSFRR